MKYVNDIFIEFRERKISLSKFFADIQRLNSFQIIFEMNDVTKVHMSLSLIIKKII